MSNTVKERNLLRETVLLTVTGAGWSAFISPLLLMSMSIQIHGQILMAFWLTALTSAGLFFFIRHFFEDDAHAHRTRSVVNLSMATISAAFLITALCKASPLSSSENTVLIILLLAFLSYIGFSAYSWHNEDGHDQEVERQLNTLNVSRVFFGISAVTALIPTTLMEIARLFSPHHYVPSSYYLLGSLVALLLAELIEKLPSEASNKHKNLKPGLNFPIKITAGFALLSMALDIAVKTTDTVQCYLSIVTVAFAVCYLLYAFDKIPALNEVWENDPFSEKLPV